MSKKKPKVFDSTRLIEAIKKWPLPLFDKKHGYYIHIEERARGNQTRIEHIVRYSHDLKVRDIESIPHEINSYFAYKKDPVYKNTYNYYLIRKGKDKGFIKVSVQLNRLNLKEAWIKTIYITYNLK